MTPRYCAMLAGLFLLTAALAPAYPERARREVKWNNPDFPRPPWMEHRSFRSASMGKEVGYNVALPDGYAGGRARYPVIYFLHGAGGDENSDAAGFAVVVRKLTEEKQLPPAICVFPNGGMSGYRDRPEEKVMGETLIVKELLPRIDRTYRTRATREGRSISGFSMGGGGAIRLALKYPDLFSSAGSWAGALVPRDGGVPPELEAENLRRVAGRVRLLLVVGDQDPTYAGHQPFVQALEEAKYPVSYKVLKGIGHNLGQYYEQTGDEMVRFLAEGLR